MTSSGENEIWRGALPNGSPMPPLELRVKVASPPASEAVISAHRASLAVYWQRPPLHTVGAR